MWFLLFLTAAAFAEDPERSCLVSPSIAIRSKWIDVRYPALDETLYTLNLNITEVQFFRPPNNQVLLRGEDTTGKSFLVLGDRYRKQFQRFRDQCEAHPKPLIPQLRKAYDLKRRQAIEELRAALDMDQHFQTCVLNPPVPARLKPNAQRAHELTGECDLVIVGQLSKHSNKSGRYIHIADPAGKDESVKKGPAEGQLVLETCRGKQILVDPRDLDARTAGEIYHRYFHCGALKAPDMAPMPELQRLPEPGTPTAI